MSASQDTVNNAKTTLNNAAEQIKAHPMVKQGQARVTDYLNQLDSELSKHSFFVQAEEKTGVPKAYGAIVAVLTFISLIFINTLALPVSNLVGWAFPAYLSYRAIESPGHEDDIQWLTYWTVFGFFTFLESIALRLVLHYFPWYFPVKTAFILWLQLPATRGAQIFYHNAFRPVLLNLRGKKPAYAGNTTTTSVGDHEKIN